MPSSLRSPTTRQEFFLLPLGLPGFFGQDLGLFKREQCQLVRVDKTLAALAVELLEHLGQAMFELLAFAIQFVNRLRLQFDFRGERFLHLPLLLDFGGKRFTFLLKRFPFLSQHRLQRGDIDGQ
ncbi:hypothetical protein [Bremerella sp.]|uniref:hypothetical protein n=1 Tax=Bremerella sp. TaxID=2795602 RepID=UPI00391BAE97